MSKVKILVVAVMVLSIIIVGIYLIKSSQHQVSLNKETFVWLWYSNPGPWNEMGASLEFNPDGTYSYDGPFDDERHMSDEGLWEIINDDTLRITTKARTDIIGGELQDTPFGDIYVGGEYRTTEIEPAIVEDHAISALQPSFYVEDGRLQIATILFGEIRFWKMLDTIMDDSLDDDMFNDDEFW